MATERYSVHSAELLAKKYAKITSEKQFGQTFWRDVFQQLCGVDDLLATGIEFEFPVRSHNSGTIKFIDVLWPGVVLVEHKSAGESLDKAECARLESVCRATYRGFKSLILRWCR